MGYITLKLIIMSFLGSTSKNHGSGSTRGASKGSTTTIVKEVHILPEDGLWRVVTKNGKKSIERITEEELLEIAKNISNS
jgi:hypothetical protein